MRRLFLCTVVMVSLGAAIGQAGELGFRVQGLGFSEPGRGSKDGDAPPDFKHEVWGSTYYGDGYVYGPTAPRSSVSVVDIDGDGDNDIAFRANYHVPAQVMRNLGTPSVFYPGGLKNLNVSDPVFQSVYLDIIMDFADVTGDGLPDLVAMANRFQPSWETYLVWYRNEGPAAGAPRDEPQFTFVDYVYTSPQHASEPPELSLDLADINGDGLVDLFFVEIFFDEPGHPHRVFFMKNVGTLEEPNWAEPEEVTALSQLMPPGIGSKSSTGGGPDAGVRMREAFRAGFKSKGLKLRVSDLEICDWDMDGLLDFMFYDALQGVDWVRNIGTETEPAWSATLNEGEQAPWRHTAPEEYGIPAGSYRDLVRAHGAFAVRLNPERDLPDVKWLNDFYINVKGWLITLRYMTGDAPGYRLIQQNSVEYPTGQGPAAFADCDGDGDLDMFRSGTGSSATSYLLLFPNIGTPYSPAWGKTAVCTDIIVSKGTVDNHYRQDLYTFADPDNDGATDFFVQEQDGTIAHYVMGHGVPPTFDHVADNMADIVEEGLTGVQPRGSALADFDQHPNRLLELIAVYASDDGGRIVYVPQDSGEKGLLSWNAPTDISTALRHEDGSTVVPNEIESIAAADLDLDGRPDLVVTLGEYNLGGRPFYYRCSHYFYRNTYNPGTETFSFDYVGRIQGPYDTDDYGSRMIGLPDIDADSDADLFIGYQVYYPASIPRRHHFRFFRNTNETGLRFWRTRLVSGQTGMLAIGGLAPEYRWIINASGGSLGEPGMYTAGPMSRVVDVLETVDLEPNYRVFVDVLPEVGPNESKAIMVVGGDPADPLYPVFEEAAAYAYWVLRCQGLPAENIRVLSDTYFDGDDDGGSDVFGPRWPILFKSSMLYWAYDADRLAVVFIDHGQRDRFRFNTRLYLNAGVYADWVNEAQAGGDGPQVTTIVDMCEAGSFIDDLALDAKARKGNAERITITSSGVGPIDGVAMFDIHGISFSAAFWGEIYQGSTYGEAFQVAKVAMESINPLQAPQIDDDGNGVANEASDGLLAYEVRPGADFEHLVSGVFIGNVAEFQVVSSDTATLWLADVVTDLPVEGAGALIVPPNYQRASLGSDDEQPVTGMDWVDLTYNELLGRWEALYDGFTEGGLFRIQYYVTAGGRYHASPRTGYVDRIDLPDAWENDDTAENAKWIPINSVQGHNFHAANDQDWLRFMSPEGKKTTIALVSPGENCRAHVELYRWADLESEPGAPPVREVTAPEAGAEVVFDHVFVDSEQYCLRIANADPAVCGVGTSYLVIVAMDTGGELMPTTLIVTVLESTKGVPLSGANVLFNNSVSSRTTGNGVVHFVCPNYGSYPLRAGKHGYFDWSSRVTVNNLVEESICYLEKEVPIISVLPSSRDLGEVEIGQWDETTFTVENTGGATLTGEASVLEPFSIVSGGSYSLAASAQQTVTVRFAPTSAGVYSETVTFGGGGGATATVTGQGVAPPEPAIAVTPAECDFGEVEVGQWSERTFTVENTGDATLEGEASVPAPFSIVSGGAYGLAPGAQQAVTVRFTPPAVGAYAETVTFTGADGATGPVTGEGVAVPEATIAVTPAGRDFGEVEVGQWTEATFTVENTGDATLEGEASVPVPFSIVSGGTYSLGPGAQQAVTVRFTPPAVGAYAETVTFSGAEGATRPVTGRGVAPPEPAIAVTPAEHDFGEVEVGQWSETTFTIENTGDATLEGEATAVEPFSIVLGGTYSLGPGVQQQVTVRFTPPAVGAYAETLTFTGADGATCAVTGQGKKRPGFTCFRATSSSPSTRSTASAASGDLLMLALLALILLAAGKRPAEPIEDIVAESGLRPF